jgi:phosphatidylglycerophosphate synthase
MASPLLHALPNSLSLARLALGIAFPWIPPPWRVSAVVLAALSDLADGAMSRRFGLCSTTGRILDPLADKVFVLSVAGTLVLEGSLEFWEVALLALRDMGGLVRGSLGVARHGWAAVRLMAPTLLGKAATLMQFSFLVTFLILGRAVLLVYVPAVVLSGLAAAGYVYLSLTSDHRAARH